MKTNQIFRGDIKICTSYETYTSIVSEAYIGDQCIGRDCLGHIELDSEFYKRNAILLRIRRDKYVDLNRIASILDYIKIYLESRRKGFYLEDLAISTRPWSKGSLFVDEKSLKPYFDNMKQVSDISILRLKSNTRQSK